MTRCWAGPLGAVKPLLAPSWFTALPRITASTRCPAVRAADSRSTTSMPTPSDQPAPSASAENARQRPSWDIPRCLLNSMNNQGVGMTQTPPTSASEHSSCRSDRTARWRATSDDEQAVSTVRVGPSRPRV